MYTHTTLTHTQTSTHLHTHIENTHTHTHLHTHTYLKGKQLPFFSFPCMTYLFEREVIWPHFPSENELKREENRWMRFLPHLSYTTRSRYRFRLYLSFDCKWSLWCRSTESPGQRDRDHDSTRREISWDMTGY